MVVGAVETHGRYETGGAAARARDPAAPKVEYRGRELEEFDLDAALARKPAVLLLDELAHTNAPGSRHTKRWQDVLELLDAGIDVHTTLNVQHVESLNDVVAQITRVHVRETVPDSVLERADEVELVDISPEELLTRLREGKVYMPEQAARAAQHFFQRGNLLALRELALRRTAERVDVDVLAYREQHGVRETWPASERILVCVGPSPDLGAPGARGAPHGGRAARAVVAAYVEPPGIAPHERERPRAPRAVHCGSPSRSAPRWCASPAPTRGRRHSRLRAQAQRHAHHPRQAAPTRACAIACAARCSTQVVRGSGDIDVHVISGDADAPNDERALAPRRPERRRRGPRTCGRRSSSPSTTGLAAGIRRASLRCPISRCSTCSP